jgi:hypothetical protein
MQIDSSPNEGTTISILFASPGSNGDRPGDSEFETSVSSSTERTSS